MPHLLPRLTHTLISSRDEGREAEIDGVRRSLTAAMVAVTAGVFALIGISVAHANPLLPAAPPTKTPAQAAVLTATASQDEAGLVTVTGNLSNAEYSPIAGAVIKISYDGTAWTSVVTDQMGSFSFSEERPAAAATSGVHTIVFTYSGAQGGGTARTEVRLVSSGGGTGTTALTAVLNPQLIAPGEVLGVSGTLVDATGAPIAGARLEVSLSLGGTGLAVTLDDGTWSLNIGLPGTDVVNPIPSSSKVTITYAGDETYPGTELTLSVAMRAPTPTPTPTETPTETASPGETPTALSSSTESAVVTKNASGGGIILTSTGLIVLAIVLVLMAAFAVFLSLVVLSRRRSALVADEQRELAAVLDPEPQGSPQA